MKKILLIADSAAGLGSTQKPVTALAPAPAAVPVPVPAPALALEHAKTIVEDIEEILEKLEGLAGHAVNIRYKLEAARDLAGNVVAAAEAAEKTALK